MKYSIGVAVLILSIVFVCCDKKPAEQNKITQPVIQSFRFYSRSVQDTFVIDVSLPKTYYVDTTVFYPLVLLTDGNWRRPQHLPIHGMSDSMGIKEVVVAGISYPQGYKVKQIRVRDFIRQPDRFHRFIIEEVLPYLHQHFRITSERLLWGSSFGGYFTLYVLFQYPFSTGKIFSYYVAASPAVLETTAIGPVGKNLFNYEYELFQLTKELPVSLYLTVGSKEDTVRFYNPFLRLVDSLEKHNYQNFTFYYAIDTGKNHQTVWEPTLYKGLQLFLSKK